MVLSVANITDLQGLCRGGRGGLLWLSGMVVVRLEGCVMRLGSVWL